MSRLLLLALAFGLSARATETYPENFRLIDGAGNAVTLEVNGDDNPVVVMAVDPACAWSASLVKWARDIVDQRAPPGTRLLLVDPAQAGDPSLLRDFSQATSRELGFRASGDFLVLDPKGRRVLARGTAFDEALPRAFAPVVWWRRLLGFARAREDVPAARVACPLPLRPLPSALSRELAAAFTRSCNECHARNESIDYFRSLKDVRSWHAMNLRVMRLYQMPPGGVDTATPLCHLFASDGTERDLALVRSWFAAGEPGSGKDEIALARRELRQAWKARALPKPDLVWKAEKEDHVGAQGSRYVITTLAGPLAEDLRVRLFDLEHNARVTHHTSLLLSDRKLDWRDWNLDKGTVSDRDAGGPIVPLLTWGRTITEPALRGGPAGTYYLLPKGKYVGLMEHYEADGREETNRSSLALYLYPRGAPGTPLHVANLAREKFKLAPGQKNFTLKKTWLAEHDVSLVSAFTHGHFRFVASSIELAAPGKPPRVVCNMPYRQAPYNPALSGRPIRLPRGSELRATLRYDNSPSNGGNPDPGAWVESGGMSDSEEMDTVRIVYTDGFLPQAVDLP